MEHEIFIINLIKNNYIQDFKAEKEKCREIYNNEIRANLGISFWEFLMEGWSLFFINKFNTNSIYFNHQCVKKFQKNVSEKGSVSKMPCIMNKEFCKLCLVEFQNSDDYEKHIKSSPHILRTSYKNNRQITNNSTKKIKVEILNSTRNIVKEIHATVKENIYLFLRVTNISKTPIKIKNILKANLNIFELDIDTSNLPVILSTGKSLDFEVSGIFDNSYSFNFTLILILREHGVKEEIFLIKELPIIITSEYSFLSQQKKQIKKTEQKTRPINGNQPKKIVKAEKRRKDQQFKSVIKLGLYDIPKTLREIIHEVNKEYPNFVLNKRDLDYEVLADIFKISLILNSGNYCEMLHTLLYIEEYFSSKDKSVDLSNLESLTEDMYKLNISGAGHRNILIGQSIFIWQNENDEAKFEAIVKKKSKEALTLKINSKFREFYSRDVEFHTEFKFLKRTFRVEHQAIDLVQKRKLEKYFFPENDVHVNRNFQEIRFHHQNLNQEQRKAVENILHDRNVPYLLFGPPGTGKTQTLVEAILQVFLMKTGSKILICTPSNASANEITSRLSKIPILKRSMYRLFGASYKFDPRFDFKGFSNVKEDEFFAPTIVQIVPYRIVVTTLMTASRLYNAGLPENHFSYVFIDESGYAKESEALIPITAFLSSKYRKGRIMGQVILAGDPKQLGPVIKSHFAGFCALDQSLLERLMTTCDIYKIGNDECVTKLIRNYRSHPEILKIPNKLFYDNELIAHETDSNRRFSSWKVLPNKNFPILFHNIDGDEKRDSDSASLYNVQEIEVVMDYLFKLFDERSLLVKQEDIGIITPYAKQVEKLTEVCKLKHWENILIGSVEQLQGKEKDVVIISTVRSKNLKKLENLDAKRDLGFVTHPQRFNVAVTRAKCLLIIVGNANFLQIDENWNSLLEHCIKNNSFMGAELLNSNLDENFNSNFCK